jgi:hypothetical protein
MPLAGSTTSSARILRLSCPAELAANTFYEAVGFRRASPRSLPGKLRPLIEWQMPILPPRRLVGRGAQPVSGLAGWQPVPRRRGCAGRPGRRHGLRQAGAARLVGDFNPESGLRTSDDT